MACAHTSFLGLQYCSAGTLSNGYMQLPHCVSLDSQCLQVWDSRIRYDLLFLHACCIFCTVVWCRPSQAFSGCNYQSLCLNFQSGTSEPLVGFTSIDICFPCSFGVPCSSFSSHCLVSISLACCLTSCFTQVENLVIRSFVTLSNCLLNLTASLWME